MQKPLHVKAVIFLLLTVIYFFGILFIWRPIQAPYLNLVGSVGTFIVNVTQPNDPISLRQSREAFVVVPQAEKVKNNPDKRRYYFFGQWMPSNMAITLALILATPGIALRRRFKILLIAFLVLFAIHVADLTVEVKRIYFTYYSNVSVESYPGWQKAMINWLSRFFIVFRSQAPPFILWGMLCFRELFSQAAPYLGPKVARNAPCPCGSGKKYKHCCGAVEGS